MMLASAAPLARYRGPARAAFIDHGPGGTGAAAALVLRPGNAGSYPAADHIAAGLLALNQILTRLHEQVIIRTGSV
ncbi:hypothetical protein HUT06_21145 [Actinomadura sp. NAK00032]|uniref:hypothetical protein n=1 Tax=Actinomadura sp. NAK00032 TaxID=2742128 RepID=UPI001591AB05|nr:hypothetical protein [Actinomadura sp. NAK00032]QKW32611.1 hypothetical protein HUT06_21145 [Actinomadura sp. NAK00032]